MSASNLHIAWAELLLSSLAASGVRNVVVSPGSRSTPLVLAAAKEIQLNSRVIIDERSAAFFALGQARASGAPTALICTSGTAAAHYFPAVIEASQAHVPLLVVSADRPWEDRDTGSSQTIDQVKMFGDYVRHFADVGPPDASAFRAVARIAAQCVHATMFPTPGPVQLNAQFRKPLEPVSVSGEEAWKPAFDEIRRRNPPKIFPARPGVDDDLDFLIGAAAGSSPRGLIVCGPSVGDESIAAPLFDLARELRFPILAECTSNVRFGNAPDDVVVAGGFDTYFRSAEFRRAHPATFALELGAAPTSAGYLAYVTEHRNLRRFVVHPHAHADPRGDAEAIGHAPIAALLRAVRARLSSVIVEPRSSAWLDAFARAERITWSRAAQDTDDRELNEGVVARAVVAALPEGGTLVVGNSNPVRDLDTFAPPKANAFNVVHQRGAAGIDGLVSGAAGYASIVPVPTILYVGDLTLLHDLAGFAALRHVSSPLVIVVVQNGGGRIFEELPIYGSSASQDTFETFFATAQDVDFEKAASAFGIRFHLAKNSADLSQALDIGLSKNGVTIIEARVPPHDGSARRKKFRADVARAIRETSS
jgi:2-succinyl-5-enolpyruvyl-6-hydroxy-3-cyclohexene-1-carboxylate synthase